MRIKCSAELYTTSLKDIRICAFNVSIKMYNLYRSNCNRRVREASKNHNFEIGKCGLMRAHFYFEMLESAKSGKLGMPTLGKIGKYPENI